MKFDFWFDLPSALSNLIEESLTKEEVAYSNFLSQTAEFFKAIRGKFEERLEENQTQIEIEEVELIKEKLQSIHKQSVELLCKCVQFSMKLMMKIIECFENYQSSSISLEEILVKIKLFSKIARLVIDKSKPTEISSEEGSEFKFLSMIHNFTGKIQSKIYSISNSIIQSAAVNKKKQCENDQISWGQIQNDTKEPIENANSC